MKNKYLKIFFLIFAVIILYLYLAHTSIYRRISYADLKATDNRHTYDLSDMASSTKKIIYAAMGDSLTSGAGTERYEESYPYLLAEYFAKDGANIVHKNFSYPGARTENLIKDLLAPAIAEKPDIITLLIGNNDVHGNVSERKFEKNYEYILSELTAKTDAKIYLINIPNIGSRTLIFPPYDIYFDSRIKRFNKIINKLAQKYDLEYIDLYSQTAELLKKDGPHYGKDSFHPSAQGYESWAKIIYGHINK